MEIVTDFIFLGSKSLQTVSASIKLKDSCSLEDKLWQSIARQHIKKLSLLYFANKDPYNQIYGFPSSHV